MLNYKGFVGRLNFNPKTMLITGEVINAKDVLVFEGKDAKAVQDNFISAVEDYLSFCESNNETPVSEEQLCYLEIVIPQEHYNQYLSAADSEHISLDEWIDSRLQQQ